MSKNILTLSSTELKREGVRKMAIEFYDVKNRKKVSVPEDQVKKTKYERKTSGGTTQVRYAVRAQVGGVNLTKFVSKDFWDGLGVSEE